MKIGLGLNKDRLLKLIGIFDEAHDGLLSLKDIPKEKVLSSRDRYVLEHLFYRLAMSTIDMCFHLPTRVGGKVPDTYKKCFDILFEHGIIDRSTRDLLGELAGLRNLIAHVYWELDYELLYDYIEQVPKLVAFRDAVIHLIE